MSARPLLPSPVCPCGRPFRRRRYWAIWDRASCAGCGRVAEVIEAVGGRWNTVVFRNHPAESKKEVET